MRPLTYPITIALPLLVVVQVAVASPMDSSNGKHKNEEMWNTPLDIDAMTSFPCARECIRDTTKYFNANKRKLKKFCNHFGNEVFTWKQHALMKCVRYGCGEESADEAYEELRSFRRSNCGW